MRIKFPLLRFGQPSRADPVLPVPSPVDIRPLPSPNADTPLEYPDRLTALLQWRRLGTLDPKSHNYVELLKRLVDVEGNRNHALELTDSDAGAVINVIDGALRSNVLQNKLAHRSFSILRKLAGNTGQLPDSYLVSGDADYQVEERIFACGGFADVRKGTLAKKPVAVKTIRIAQDRDISKIRKDFCKESVLWMHISHPNVLELIGVDIDPQNGTFSLISELMVNGNIMDYIRVAKTNRVRLLEDVTRGLRHLHRCGIVHGDLKAANILIKNGATPKACISDFGFSSVAPTASFAMPASVDENKGTWSHMAPELLFPEKFGLPDGRISKQADIYAFGMVVYEVLTGRIPFTGEGRWFAEIIMRVMEGKRPSKPENADDIGFGRGTWELVQRCWQENRDRRPTVDDVSKHFQRVVRTSKAVPPGSAMLVREIEHPTVSEPDSSSGDYVRLFDPSLQMSTSLIQQFKFVADVMAGGDKLHSAVSVPSVRLIRAKPSLLHRLGARIKGRSPALRLGPPPPPLE